jgi:hypothetical protein
MNNVLDGEHSRKGSASSVPQRGRNDACGRGSACTRPNVDVPYRSITSSAFLTFSWLSSTMTRNETGNTSYDERSLRNARRASSASWCVRGLSGATGRWVARDGRRTTEAPPADCDARRAVRDTEPIRPTPSPGIEPGIEAINARRGGLRGKGGANGVVKETAVRATRGSSRERLVESWRMRSKERSIATNEMNTSKGRYQWLRMCRVESS